MSSIFKPGVASSPCLLGNDDPDMQLPDTAPANTTVLHSLSRVFGIRLDQQSGSDEGQLLSDLTRLFHRCQVPPETPLEEHDTPWHNVYLIQHGVLRLFRESPTGKIAIHHFFTEGDLVWPLFGRSRTVRNTLCLTTTTAATVWVADFAAFRSLVQSHGDALWPRFALALTEELAELTSMREYRRNTLPAAERYQLLLEEYPELVRRIPDNQLASWIGVVPATFSRLKTGAAER